MKKLMSCALALVLSCAMMLTGCSQQNPPASNGSGTGGNSGSGSFDADALAGRPDSGGPILRKRYFSH